MTRILGEHRTDGRHFAPRLEARAMRDEATGELSLYAPRPGLLRDAPRAGTLVRGGDAIGALEILGVLHGLFAPEGAFGVVKGVPEGKHLARRPCDAGTRLMVLDKEAIDGASALEVGAIGAAGGGPVFKTPLGGRYYASPSPGAEPFVRVGAQLSGGETVALIEVMKTFNRVQYQGAPATVAAIVPRDGDDLEAGDPILRFEDRGRSEDHGRAERGGAA